MSDELTKLVATLDTMSIAELQNALLAVQKQIRVKAKELKQAQKMTAEKEKVWRLLLRKPFYELEAAVEDSYRTKLNWRNVNERVSGFEALCRQYGWTPFEYYAEREKVGVYSKGRL